MNDPWSLWDQEREPDELGGQFGFMSGVNVEFEGGDVLTTSYVVRLPHQCDYWEIANAANKDEAIAAMEEFVREAQAALEKLREAQ